MSKRVSAVLSTMLVLSLLAPTVSAETELLKEGVDALEEVVQEQVTTD